MSGWLIVIALAVSIPFGILGGILGGRVNVWLCDHGHHIFRPVNSLLPERGETCIRHCGAVRTRAADAQG